jgi:hypothetical protein
MDQPRLKLLQNPLYYNLIINGEEIPKPTEKSQAVIASLSLATGSHTMRHFCSVSKILCNE